MQILADAAPPSGAPSLPSPTVTTTQVPATQLPVTGASDVAYGALGIGGLTILVGAAVLLVLRHRRLRTG